MLKVRPARRRALRRQREPARAVRSRSPGQDSHQGPSIPFSISLLILPPLQPGTRLWAASQGSAAAKESPDSARPLPGPTALRPWMEAAPLSSPPLPRGSLAHKVQRMELYFSPERSGREGARPSPSYSFCCLLPEPATSIQEQTQQRNRPATVIYTA